MLILISIIAIATTISTIYLILSRAKVLAENDYFKKANESVVQLMKKIESNQLEIESLETTVKIIADIRDRLLKEKTVDEDKLKICHETTNDKKDELKTCKESFMIQLKNNVKNTDKLKEYEISIQKLNSELNEWNEVADTLKGINGKRHAPKFAKEIILKTIVG
tara:strand:- start:3011 stop:3505 length:495 start_codon:yes stop_codon:yes gene_type:complete